MLQPLSLPVRLGSRYFFPGLHPPDVQAHRDGRHVLHLQRVAVLVGRRHRHLDRRRVLLRGQNWFRNPNGCSRHGSVLSKDCFGYAGPGSICLWEESGQSWSPAKQPTGAAVAFPAYAAFEVTQLKANLHKGISKRDFNWEISIRRFQSRTKNLTWFLKRNFSRGIFLSKLIKT